MPYFTIWRTLLIRIVVARAAAAPMIPSPSATSDPTPSAGYPWLAIVNSCRPSSSSSRRSECAKPRKAAMPLTVVVTIASRSVHRLRRAVSSPSAADPAGTTPGVASGSGAPAEICSISATR